MVSLAVFRLFLVFLAVFAIFRTETTSGSTGFTIVMDGRASRADFPFVFSLDIVSVFRGKSDLECPFEIQKDV